MDWTRKGERRTDPDRPRPLADHVLHLIWKEKRVSRADIARIAGLSRSTVSEIVGEILPSGLVAEVGAGQSSGGRRPIVLEFRDDACVILGVEMGAAHVCVALTNLRGEILHWVCGAHPVRTDPEGTRRLISDLCQQCMELPLVQNRPLLGIGVGAPCPIDPSAPRQLSKVVMPAWEGHLDLQDLAGGFDVPIMVDNDANLGALAEHWWGAGQGIDHFAYIKVATGIGCGHVIRGQVYRGATGVAGEIGHISLDPFGKPCICGLRGCLVTHVGSQALVDRMAELLPRHTSSVLKDSDLNIANLEKAAQSGDFLALKIVREAAEHLGVAVAGLLNITNPSLIVVGGDLAAVGKALIQPLRETIQQRTLVSSVAAAEIKTSKIGSQAVAVGAATLILKAALEDSSYFPPILPAKPDASPKKKEGTG